MKDDIIAKNFSWINQANFVDFKQDCGERKFSVSPSLALLYIYGFLKN